MSSPTPSVAEREVAQALAQAAQLRAANSREAAESVCRRLLATYPAAVPAMNFLAVLLRERGAFDEAEPLLRQAIALAPKEPVLFNSLGSVLLQKDDAAGAEDAYRQAAGLKTDYAEAHYNHGIALHRLGRDDEAIEAQRRAIALRPDFTEAMVQLATLLQARGVREDALAILDDVLRRDPKHFGALYTRGVVLDSLDRHQDAIAPLSAALALRPRNHQAAYVLGNALNFSGRGEEALDAYAKAIETAPDFVAAHVDYNRLAWTLGRKDLMFSSFAYARGRIGERPDLLLAESEQRLRFDEAPVAEGLLKRARETAPERGDILNALGRALVTQGRFDEAMPVFERAAHIEPGRVAHDQQLAIACLHAGQPQNATAALRRALAVAPFDQFTLALLTLADRDAEGTGPAGLVDMDRHVRTYDLPPLAGFVDAEAFNRALAQDLARLHTHRAEPYDQTLRGGTQTMGQLFANPTPTIQRLREWIDACIDDYIRAMPDDPAHPLFGRRQAARAYAGSWSCHLKSGGYHTNHVHPRGWISSVYYVSVPDAVADETRKEGWLKFGESNLALGGRDRYTDAIRPRNGKLVLFPSYFWHGTIPFASNDPRLTVAFDVVPGGRRTPDRWMI